MVRPENLTAKLSSLRRHLGLLRTFQTRSLDEIRSDPYLQGALERYLFLAAQSAIDLAEMVCLFKGLGPVTSMSEGFEALERAGLLPAPLSQSLQRMVWFREGPGYWYDKPG